MEEDEFTTGLCSVQNLRQDVVLIIHVHRTTQDPNKRSHSFPTSTFHSLSKAVPSTIFYNYVYTFSFGESKDFNLQVWGGVPVNKLGCARAFAIPGLAMEEDVAITTGPVDDANWIAF